MLGCGGSHEEDNFNQLTPLIVFKMLVLFAILAEITNLVLHSQTQTAFGCLIFNVVTNNRVKIFA